MSYYAEVDTATNLVTRVIVADLSFIVNTLPQRSGYTWVETDLSGRFHKNYAGIGYTWDAGRAAFIAPKPYPSWVLDEATCQWMAPVPRPGVRYYWDEAALSWVAVD